MLLLLLLMMMLLMTINVPADLLDFVIDLGYLLM
jgi:hypothetical protein